MFIQVTSLTCILYENFLIDAFLNMYESKKLFIIVMYLLITDTFIFSIQYSVVSFYVFNGTLPSYFHLDYTIS